MGEKKVQGLSETLITPHPPGYFHTCKFIANLTQLHSQSNTPFWYFQRPEVLLRTFSPHTTPWNNLSWFWSPKKRRWERKSRSVSFTRRRGHHAPTRWSRSSGKICTVCLARGAQKTNKKLSHFFSISHRNHNVPPFLFVSTFLAVHGSVLFVWCAPQGLGASCWAGALLSVHDR